MAYQDVTNLRVNEDKVLCMNWQDVHVNLQYIDSAVVEVWFRNSTGDP